MTRLSVNQERFFLQNNTYTNNLAQLGFPGGLTESGLYQIAVPAANANTFNATAVPPAGSPQLTDDDCQNFGINERGVRTSAPSLPDVCWR